MEYFQIKLSDLPPRSPQLKCIAELHRIRTELFKLRSCDRLSSPADIFYFLFILDSVGV